MSFVPGVVYDSYTAYVRSLSPYLYWTFRETSGTVITDYSGNGHTGALNTGAGAAFAYYGATNTPAEVNNRGNIGFNLSGTFLGWSSVAVTDFPVGSFSVQLWFRAQSTGTRTNEMISYCSGASTPNQFAFLLTNLTTTQIQVTHQNFGTQRTWTVTTPRNAQYHHIVWVRDNVGATEILYYDNVAGTSFASTAGSVASQTGTLTVGNSQASPGVDRGGTSQFVGYLHDFAIFPSALTAGQVSSLYTGCPAERRAPLA
jgi:hypothetical protein